MTAAYKKVNQHVVYVQQLLSLIPNHSDESKKVLMQAAYLQLELAILFYCLELKGGAKEEGFDINTSTLAVLVSPSGFLQLQRSLEIDELRLLSLTSGTWLSVLIDRLNTIRSVGSRIDGLKGTLFDSTDVDFVEDSNNLLSLIDISNDADCCSVVELNNIVFSFKELVLRHRSVNEEY